MQLLNESVGKTTDALEILLNVSYTRTLKGVFQTTNFEMKIFILKFVKNATFYPKMENWHLNMISNFDFKLWINHRESYNFNQETYIFLQVPSIDYSRSRQF